MHNDATTREVDLQWSAGDPSDALHARPSDQRGNVEREFVARIRSVKRFETSGRERSVALRGVVTHGNNLSTLSAKLVEENRRASSRHVEEN
jgi:hypothetical protein